MGMAKGGVDDAVVRHAEHEFVDTNPRKEIVLGKQPIIGGVVEIEDILEMRIIIGDTREHARGALAVFRGNEAVGVVLTDKARPRQSHMPPRRASTSRRTICMAGRPPVIM